MTRKLSLVFIFLFSFSACRASFGSIETGTLTDRSSPSTGEGSFVFGHLIIDWQEREPPIDTIERLDSMKLIVINQVSGAFYQIVCERGGRDSHFFAALPAGKYRVTKWEKGRKFRNMFETFEVGAGEIRYLGTLRWFRGVFTAVQGNLIIEDDFEEETDLFKKNYPEAHGPIEKAVMRSAQN
jgi:hypothetical protein